MPDTSTLSLCLIAKNEETHLARCLASVRDLVDEMIVVDTGSTDRTVEIARSFGARVLSFAWQDDFSLARNFSLEQATSDWLLVLDADESIATRDHAQIRALIARDDLNAVTAQQRHYLVSGTVVGWRPGPGGYDEGKPYPGFFDVECRRLFRNRPWLRFQNRVHEELRSIDPAHPLVQIQADWIIHHYGKAEDGARLRKKGEAYLRIGLQKLKDKPRDPLAHYELGIQFLELEQPREALACFTQAQGLAQNFRDTALRIAICHIRLKEHDKALKALKTATRTLPQFRAEIALEEGNLHRQLDNLPAAEAAFRRALVVNPAFAAASVNVALLCQRQGRLDDAVASLDHALSHCPGHFEALALRAQIRRDCRRRRRGADRPRAARHPPGRPAAARPHPRPAPALRRGATLPRRDAGGLRCGGGGPARRRRPRPGRRRRGRDAPARKRRPAAVARGRPEPVDGPRGPGRRARRARGGGHRAPLRTRGRRGRRPLHAARRRHAAPSGAGRRVRSADDLLLSAVQHRLRRPHAPHARARRHREQHRLPVGSPGPPGPPHRRAQRLRRAGRLRRRRVRPMGDPADPRRRRPARCRRGRPLLAADRPGAIRAAADLLDRRCLGPAVPGAADR